MTVSSVRTFKSCARDEGASNAEFCSCTPTCFEVPKSIGDKSLTSPPFLDLHDEVPPPRGGWIVSQLRAVR